MRGALGSRGSRLEFIGLEYIELEGPIEHSRGQGEGVAELSSSSTLRVTKPSVRRTFSSASVSLVTSLTM